MTIKVPRWKPRRSLKRVGPSDDLDLSDVLWPRRHGRWWNWDSDAKEVKKAAELYEGLPADSVEEAKDTLDHTREIAQTAVERAAAADRRATTIAGTVAIAASFTLGGAGLLVDPAKVTDGDLRRALAVLLFVITVSFVLSAIFALRALVATRTWAWVNPHDVDGLPTGEVERIRMRAAHLLDDFATNWEISDLKNRCVDRALLFLIVALIGIGALAAVLVCYAF